MKLKSMWKQVVKVTPDLISHQKGVKQGNSPGHYEKNAGFLKDGRATSTRSTGIFPGEKDPIHPDMPNISAP
ncbi:MAG TPA: hypothetical protein VE992_00415 [Solirubrobacteraceae bacterium]|nr:hypothetical protein [Solirubrobacteraceae bacterium]